MLVALGVCANGCVHRPLPPRASLDTLINQALQQSSADLGGDPHFVTPHPSTHVTFTDDGHAVWHAKGGLGNPDPQEHIVSETIVSDEHALNAIQSDSPSSGAIKHAPQVIRGATIGLQSYTEPVVFDDDIRINEEFIETDIREALTLLATEAEIDLVLDDQVTGIINAQINDLTVDQAIAKVLMPLGIVHVRRGEQIIVAPPDPASPLFSYVAVRQKYRPMNLEPNQLVESVPNEWLQYVTVIEPAKAILIEAPRRIADDILDRFRSVDQPIPQVVLEAIICVISPDSGFQFGVDWNHAVRLDDVENLALGASSLALSGSVSGQGLDNIFSDFSTTSAFIRLLCEHGYLTIRATPHVMARDGEQANISINRETFFSVQPPGANADGSVFFQQEIQKVDAGIMLDITPHIQGDVVTIDIEKAEVSEDIRNANSELAVNPFPIINRRSVSTTVSVKDGKTIVIGGLVQRETIDRVNRVPGLSRLPGVGYLFETTQRQTREAEVVIFISPRIIRSPSPVADGPLLINAG
ncbi:MAG: protein transporter [Planctomycetota bacterium]